jgi:hypothetical protein
VKARVTCAAPLETSELLGYWLGELPAEREAEVEEHLFACRECSAALGELVALGDAFRALLAGGGAAGVVPPEFVARLKAAGLRVREYRMEPQGSIDCTIAPHDDLVLAHLEAPLEGVERLDVVIHEIEARRTQRLEDVGFSAASREVVVVPKARDLRGIDKASQRVELIAVSPAGERLLGTYTFHHSRYRRG